MPDLVIRILVAIVAIVVISVFIQPLLIGLIPPLGVICVIALYLGVLFWVLNGYTKWW